MAEDRGARGWGWRWSAVLGGAGAALGCGPTFDLPPGTFALEAAGESAAVFSHGPTPGGTIEVVGGGCADPKVRVALWSAGIVTPGGLAMPAAVTPTEHGSEVWLSVPVETGVGEGQVAIWWSPEAGLARLPLGGRPGELELAYTARAVDALPTVPDEAMARLAEETAAWDEGAFLLEDENGAVVGAVELVGAHLPARVGVWDALWLSDGMVPAARADDGGDLILQFAAEPRIGSGDAMLRLNVVTRRVAVPAAPHPSPMDRWLRARPGRLTDAQMEATIAAAMDAADGAERAWVEELGPKLARAVHTPTACVPPAQADPAWELMLAGYATAVHRTDSGACVVLLEADPVQHRRRFRGWVSADGVLPEADWPQR